MIHIKLYGSKIYYPLIGILFISMVIGCYKSKSDFTTIIHGLNENSIRVAEKEKDTLFFQNVLKAFITIEIYNLDKGNTEINAFLKNVNNNAGTIFQRHGIVFHTGYVYLITDTINKISYLPQLV